ncbi:phosphatase PAP2 family protein [Myroides marinus]|uniref:PAP2 superfamily protein n=1 Tax=Myroides marinus TaxID=703342 RepID=A0A161RYK1_9FLAO|nr:phosphatase PAP2 family protein [Myroides marinus]KUF45133.1 phosphoesterase [Myroides marinus]KZE76739.1 phosphoesterase [Myroides marinus]MDM1346459.1 phosphatase PAP2 family protein [Myroides marinus]MDM1349878.1 phosphatase PAP2 family protein [Myroides marinus]MDM1354686.1 phosphatase PAP2 family protein [Myroides marinus]
MNKIILTNYSRLRLLLFFLPIVLLIIIACGLYSVDCLSTNGYIAVQKDTFLFMNSSVRNYPHILFNLTQFGDAMIFLSFLSIFVIYAPKIWESLITASIFSLIFTVIMKEFFAIPRPAAALSSNTFNIIGERLAGSNSFPSGHSITVFTILTVLMFAFMPYKIKHKVAFFVFVTLLGLLFAFTRVGVGAHYPLDVIVGCIIGYICGLLGTFVTKKYQLWNWIYNKKYYPIFIVLMIIACIIVINRIRIENLFIYYMALISLFITLYKSYATYLKK